MGPFRNKRGGARALPATVVGASIYLIVAGAGYRALSSHLNRTPGRVPIPPGTLARLPLEIGDWDGWDEPLDEAVVKAADVDDYVNRFYVRKTDNQAVGLWVASGVRARDLLPHQPEVCYPGAGWTLRDKYPIVLQLAARPEVRARILSFAPGGLDPRRLTVLNYYIVDGDTCEDVSLLRSKAWRGQGSIHYMTQVQITCRSDPVRAVHSPAEAVRAFAAESFPLIEDVLRRAVGIDVAGQGKGRP